MAVVGVGSVKLTYPDGKEWYLIMDAIAVLVEESTLTLTKDGVKLRALDPSRTAMVDLYMPRTAFDEYPDVDQDVNIGINFGEIKKILRRAGKGSSVSFEVEENSLKIRMTGKVTRTVKLPLIDVPVEQLPTPKVVFTVTAKLASDALRQAIKDVEVIADAAKFEGKEDGLYIRASSDRGETEIKFERGGEVLFEYDNKETATATYSVDYLSDIVNRAYQISDIATVEFATQKPLALTFEISGGGTLAYFVAPRIE